MKVADTSFQIHSLTRGKAVRHAAALDGNQFVINGHPFPASLLQELKAKRTSNKKIIRFMEW
jgi:hypothetical protein